MLQHLFIILIILSQQIQSIFFGEKPKNTSSASYEPFPFTLIKTQNGIKVPTHYEIRWTMTFQKKIQFYHRKFIKQLVFCPAQSKKDKELIIKTNLAVKENGLNFNKINEDCLYVLESFIQKSATPYPRCARQPNPVILKIFKDGLRGIKNDGVDSQKTCGHDEEIAKEYSIGYQICHKLGWIGKLGNFIGKLVTKTEGYPLDDVEDYPMYRFCYSSRNKRTVYTKHRLISPNLLSYRQMEKERKQNYKIDASTSNLPGLSFEQTQKAYEKIENLCLEKTKRKSQQSEKISNGKTQPRFKIQYLVPSDDFAFALWRKPTFHWANTQLMHENLIEYWDHINEFIRDNAIEYEREFTIYTGAFTISPQGSNEILLMEGIQIPQIWVKIIDNSHLKRFRNNQYFRVLKKFYNTVVREGVAIIANNYLNENVSKLIDDLDCSDNLCENFAQTDFPKIYNHIRCCPVTEKIMKLFEIKLKVYTVYEIEGLIKHVMKHPHIVNKAI